MKKRIYFENLDGLRFLCFLAVFLYHSFHTEFTEIRDTEVYHFVKRDLFGNGFLGVNFFFVLSGFLITYLLIEEKKLNGNIDLKGFWIRRILRIWPLFYFCVFFGFFIFPMLKEAFGQTPKENANIFYHLAFLSNFDFLYNGKADASIIGVLWSVAIEEQFYLVWPIILYIFPIKRLWIPFSIILVSSLIFRAYNNSTRLNEFHTLSCIGDMVIGATGAWLIATSEKFRLRFEKIGTPSIVLVYLIFIGIFFFRDEVLMPNYYVRIFERSFVAIVILFIIIEQNFSQNSFFKISKFKTISSLGLITYGLYCLHFIGILITTNITKLLGFNTKIWQVLIFETIVALIITIGISWVSYRYFEKPFLVLKNKFSHITK